MFDLINRDALILFPKKPLFDWVNYIYPEDKLDCPEVMTHDEGTVFLIPQFDSPEETIEFLQENFIDFFEHELFEWTTDEDLWPDEITWELFEEWFHYSIQSLVADTVDDEIEKDDF